jgi:hypothetical protein
LENRFCTNIGLYIVISWVIFHVALHKCHKICCASTKLKQLCINETCPS